MAVVGCGGESEIRTYTVPKEQAATVAPPVAEPSAPMTADNRGEPTDRLLGAILPAGAQTWYFKAVGPLAAMEKNAEAISEFFKSIQVKPGEPKPVWATPAGWQEQAGSGMRAATLMIPAEPKSVEMSVIALPTTGAPGELLSNVNRWLGQLQLPPVDESGLAATTKQIKNGDATLTIVDARGRFSGGMAPFAGGGGPFSGGPPAGAPPFAGGAPSATPAGEAGRTDLPPGHPPVNVPGAGDAGSTSPLEYKAPADWQSQPVGGMRKAAFKIGDGTRAAEVTVIDLLASAPNVADPLSNINIWRGQIGLAPITQEQIAGVVQKINVDGKQSDYVELFPEAGKAEESAAAEAILAATVPAGESIWFFKLKGDRALVEAQRDNFKSFLESVRFKSADGAGDGNNR